MRQTRTLTSSLAQLASCPSTTRANCTPANNCSILMGTPDATVSGSFDYTAAVDTRNGLLAISMINTQQGESVRLYQEVHVSNAP